jgi:hypothetical protein
MAEVKKLKEWTFYFIGGGWNTEWAYTKAQAKKQAKKRFDSPNLQVDMDSFHIASEEETKHLLSLFY